MRRAIRIHGKVHGVGFRASAKRKAEKFNLKGFVRNEPDGTVFIIAEGDAFDFEVFLAWCRRGPWGAEVVRVEVAEHGGGEEFRGFEVQ